MEASVVMTAAEAVDLIRELVEAVVDNTKRANGILRPSRAAMRRERQAIDALAQALIDRKLTEAEHDSVAA